jgi:hypothetical protein
MNSAGIVPRGRTDIDLECAETRVVKQVSQTMASGRRQAPGFDGLLDGEVTLRFVVGRAIKRRWQKSWSCTALSRA